MQWLGLGDGTTDSESSAAAGRTRRANRYYSGPVSDHYDGTLFFNPGGEPPSGVSALLRWQFGGGRVPWPAEWASPFPQTVPERRVEGERLVVTMVGHATLLIQTAGLNILTDPVWSLRASPFTFAGPRRIGPPGVAFEDLPPIDLVLLSHNHYDHLDLATLARLHREHDPQVITPLGNDTIVRGAISGMRVSAHDWGEVTAFGSVPIHIEPAHHWSARGTRDRRMALWAGFVVETPDGKIYIVGDTGFHDGINYRAAAEKHGGFRLAVLPIGAYEPRWFMKAQHQNPDEAVQGMLLARARHAVGHHWGAFRLTDEAFDEPPAHLEAALDHHGVPRDRFRALHPGEVWEVPADIPA